MQYEIHYVVVPKPDLVVRIRQTGSAVLSDLEKPIVWKGIEYDRSFLPVDDTVALFKALFIAALLRDRANDDGFHQAFGEIEVSPAQFDSRWEMTRLRAVNVDEELEDVIEAGQVDRLKACTNKNVAALLDRFVEKLHTLR